MGHENEYASIRAMAEPTWQSVARDIMDAMGIGGTCNEADKKRIIMHALEYTYRECAYVQFSTPAKFLAFVMDDATEHFAKKDCAVSLPGGNRRTKGE